MGAFVRLLAAVAFDVGGPRLAHGAAVLTLRHWTAFFVDVLERSVYCGFCAKAMCKSITLSK